jgi:uncharacterized protein
MDLAAPAPERQPPLRPPAEQVSPRAVLWWRLRSLIGLLVVLLPQLGALILFSPDAPTWLWVSTVGTALAGGLYVGLVPPLRYRISRWEITPEAVYTLSGWLVREWRIAPISRIQTVDTERGPLQQLLELADLTVTTASARGPVKISGLSERDATELARTLTETTQATPGDAT